MQTVREIIEKSGGFSRLKETPIRIDNEPHMPTGYARAVFRDATQQRRSRTLETHRANRFDLSQR